MSKIPNSKSQITNSQTNFRETVFRLPSLSIFSIFLLSLFTNDQWLMTNDHSQPQPLYSVSFLNLFTQPLSSASLLMTNDQWPFSFSASLLKLILRVFVVKQVSLFFFPLPKKEPKKATAKEHLTGVRSVPANGI